MNVLSFGAGLQTTALVILLAQGKVKADMVVFADTGGERPETYWYMERYSLPLLSRIGIPFHKVKKESEGGLSLYDYKWEKRDIPWVMQRECSDHFKRRPINQFVGKEAIQMIGFSTDEMRRADKAIHKGKIFPLIELGLSAKDCRRVIEDYGWMIPIKSSCFFCPFQRPWEWNWLKANYPDLFQKALALEARFHERKPELRDRIGLFGGLSLRKFAKGDQGVLFTLEANSCWDGLCGR